LRASLLGELLESSACRWPDQPALVFPGQRLSYSELYRGAQLRARALEQCGVGSREHVGIFMPNSTDFLLWMFGCALHGSVAVLVNARYKSSELAYVLRNAELVCLVTRGETDGHQNYPALLSDTLPELSILAPNTALEEAPLLRQIILCGVGKVPEGSLFVTESIVLEKAAENAAPVGPASPESPCLILYTSGTTSRPKGCVLDHQMLTNKAAAIVERLAFRADDRQWNPLPFYHLASLMPMLACFASGGRYISDSHFDSERAWEQILNEQATILYPAFPTIMSELVTHPRFAELDTRQVRLINNVAPPDRLRENMRLLPHSIHISAYGLTEGTGISCFSHLGDDDQTRTICIGKPLSDTQLRIVDSQSGALRAAGEQGEIQLAGPSVFAGYYQAPEANTEAFSADGWLRTGDIGSLDSNGRLAYHGRLKEMLKVGGENVSALEIESILSTHPAVKMVQVVGVPDPRLDEVVAAFVELNPGANFDAESFIAYCRERLASFKVPRYVRFVSEWPMSSTKVQKFRLRDELIAELDCKG
jgi:acyl-CoA synthetase (AMP-forming)/AMP-acid ligase II